MLLVLVAARLKRQRAKTRLLVGAAVLCHAPCGVKAKEERLALIQSDVHELAAEPCLAARVCDVCRQFPDCGGLRDVQSRS